MSHFWMLTCPVLVLAFLLGSLSSAILVCRAMGLPDPRSEGSKNPGATNVLRFGGKKAAALTLIGDVLKGWIPVMLGKLWGLDTLTLTLIAFAVFLGHLYPVFFQFKGGKGVAPALGGLAALAWPLGLALIVTWLIVAMLFRYSSLAALVTAVPAPWYTVYFVGPWPGLVVLCMSVLLFYRHKKNIHQLYAGTEKKIGAPKT